MVLRKRSNGPNQGLGLSLSKQERLRHYANFSAAYQCGRRVKGPHFTLLYRPNACTFNRLGVVVSKKRFNLSVERHYIQRRLREAYRLNKQRFVPGYDFIISVHSFRSAVSTGQARSAAGPRLAEVIAELLSLAAQAGLLSK